MPRAALTWSSDPASGSHRQVIELARGEKAVLPFEPADAGPAPAAMAFVVAAEPEGAPLFAELTVGAGIAYTSQPDGTFAVTVGADVTADIQAGEYVWGLWSLDDPKRPVAGGTVRVVATARRPG